MNLFVVCVKSINQHTDISPLKNEIFIGKDVGVAICKQIKVMPHNSNDLEFALSWDMPKIQFHKKIKEYNRYSLIFSEKKNEYVAIVLFLFLDIIPNTLVEMGRQPTTFVHMRWKISKDGNK